jgi:hypothetical protein
MSEPFENKYKQIRQNLTDLRVRYSELKRLHDVAIKNNYDMIYQLRIAHNTLYKAGYRRLEDMSWTNEPLETDGI